MLLYIFEGGIKMNERLLGWLEKIATGEKRRIFFSILIVLDFIMLYKGSVSGKLLNLIINSLYPNFKNSS